MKKRILALLLTFCLLLTTPALAVYNSTDNFTRTRTYTHQFSDLAVGSVFYDNVAALYEYGLSVGKGDGTYGLTDSMTVGQAVIFAGRIRSLYRTGDPETGPNAYSSNGGPVALRYLRYLQAEGVLDTALDSSLTSVATRAQMAHVLAGVLPESALPSVHDATVTQAYASRQFITDVTEYTPYYQDILDLYRTGVCIGSDETGSFLPDSAITRGAAAAMLTRIVDPSLRVTPQWDLESIWDQRTLGDLVTAGQYIAAPTTAAEMDESIRYMLASDSNTLVLRYDSLDAQRAQKVLSLAMDAVKQYVEQSYNSVRASYSTLGGITLTFSAANLDSTQITAYREEALESAISVREELWASGALREDMTEKEKARVYYTWICENCTYDYGAADDSLSHIAYSLFHSGTAVCDGYTGAYNLLLKLEGIQCYGLANDTHMWTVATLDGTEYHIDTTWGDGGRTVNYTYFAMTAEQSYRHHAW